MRNTSFLEGVGEVGGTCWKSFVNYRHAERALQLFPDPLFNSCLLQSLHCASSACIWPVHHACGIRHLRIMLKTLLLMRHNNEGNRLPLVSNKRVILQDAEASFKQTGAQWSVSESTLLRHDEICKSNWLYVVLQTWWKYAFKPFFLFMEKLDARVDENSQNVVDGVWTTFDVSNQKWRKPHSTCTLYTLI